MLTSVFQALAVLDRFFCYGEPRVTATEAEEALDFVRSALAAAQLPSAPSPTLFEAGRTTSFFEAQGAG